MLLGGPCIIINMFFPLVYQLCCFVFNAMSFVCFWGHTLLGYNALLIAYWL